ncbi:MAG: hypothetical protein V4539_12035 [Bacteroidota bacterium]
MFTKKNILLISMIAGILFLIQACTKNTTVYVDNAVEVTTEVSFSKDVQPIFTAKCSTSGCHNSGGHVPDLTADKSYNAIINGSYADKSTPVNSSLYLWLTGKKTTAMPVGGPSNPSNLNQLVLAWVKQGAKNN